MSMKPKTKKILIVTGITAAAILIIALIFWGTYSTFVNKSNGSYEKSIKDIVKQIDEKNSSTIKLLDKEVINSDKTKTELPKMTEEMIKLKEKLQGLVPSEKYVKDHANLVAGLNSNIYIYKQITVILNNPQAKDIEKALEDLKKYRSECMNYYSLINLKNTTVGLNANSTKFIEAAIGYVDTAVKTKKQTEITKAIVSEFITKVDSITAKFAPQKTDLNSLAITARNNGDVGFSNALSEIESKQKQLEEINETFAQLAPNGKDAKIVHTALQKALTTYGQYVQSFNYALGTERTQTSTNQVNRTVLDSLYADANQKFAAAQDDYETFLKLFAEFRDTVPAQ